MKTIELRLFEESRYGDQLLAKFTTPLAFLHFAEVAQRCYDLIECDPDSGGPREVDILAECRATTKLVDLEVTKRIERMGHLELVQSMATIKALTWVAFNVVEDGEPADAELIAWIRDDLMTSAADLGASQVLARPSIFGLVRE